MARKVTSPSELEKVRSEYRWSRNHQCKDDIYKAYKKPSRAKVLAWPCCKNLCEAYNGRNLKILHAGCQLFSAGFEFFDKDGVFNYMWITKSEERYAEV